MKILSVLNPSLTDYKISGAALLGINLGNYINERRYLDFSDEHIDFIANEAINSLIFCTEDSTKIYVPENLNKRSVISDTIKYAVKVFKEGGYDTMHIHIHQMSVLSAIQEYVPANIPVVYTQHTSTILGRFSLGYRDSARYLSTTRDRKIRIVMPSNALKDIWKEYTGLSDEEMVNVRVIRNGIKEYPHIQPHLKRDDRLFACGRIDPNKGMLEIAEWCAKYKHPITIVGDFGVGSMKVSDNLNDYYDKFVTVCNDNKDIINWVSYMSNEDIRRELVKSKACVSFSAKESFALIVAEAMSVNTPVFCIEEDAICELLGKDYPVVHREELYRKRKDARMNIIENDYKIFEHECDNHSLYQRYIKLGLSMYECAKAYEYLYSEVRWRS